VGRNIIIVAALVSLAACDQNSGQQGPHVPDVGVVTLKAHTVLLKTELPGRAAPYAESVVRPQVNGIIQARLFKEGSKVTAGQALYQIDPKPYQAAYNSARAQLASAQAAVKSSRARAERFGSLRQQNAISQQDFDDAQAAYQQGQASVQQQAANTQAAKINLDYTRITAPITGIIGRSMVTQGALVTANQPDALATIQTLDPIYVDINQSSEELVALKRAVENGVLTRSNTPQSAKATLTLSDGSDYTHEGVLEFSEVAVDQTTGSVTLRARFPNPEGLLLPGMYVRVKIVEGTDKNALLAPQQGIGRDEKGQATALVVDAKGIVRLHVLKLGRAIGNAWLVQDGLKAGDRLVVEGMQNVRPDMPVHAVAAGAQPKAEAAKGPGPQGH
ncbi:MAG TPA: efflux RND transporter periplasmic adaptor subunit, partial [Devosia sp.]|nr:efflux RND transporter periplasmic adaptor subunit [Devosia sp.]